MRLHSTDDIAVGLCASHGLDTSSIRAFPGGFAARVFAVEATTGRFCLKLWPDTEAGRRNAARQPAVLPLVRALHDAGFASAVPAVPCLNGQLSGALDGAPFALFPWIDGSAAPATLTPDLARRLGASLARLHAPAPDVRAHIPVADPYDISFLERLESAMRRLQAMDFGGKPAIGSLRTTLFQREETVRAAIAGLRALHREVVSAETPLVLCHRDLAGDNVLVRRDGALAIVDWDDAGFAPPEHDLAFAAGDPCLPELLDAYRAAGGRAALELRQVAFFETRRTLFDATARLVRALDENPTASEDTMVMFAYDAYRDVSPGDLAQRLAAAAPAFAATRNSDAAKREYPLP